MGKSIINRKASKKVTSYYRDNRKLNMILESQKKVAENNKNEGGKHNVK